jgi:peptidylprolyl isomerase
MVQAKNGDNVSVHFTARLVDGTIFDSSLGKEPLPVDLGSGGVIAGLEEAVLGMSVGDSKTVNIPSDKAYGQYYEGKVINFPVNRLPADIEPEIGMHMQLHSKDGQPFIVRVIEVSEEHVRIDANPPLAGQDLVFDIELMAINT